MQAKVIRFTRPDERLMRPQEAAERMGVDIRVARDFIRIHGMKLGGRFYITEERLREALKEVQGR